jgi:hypothetical protein
VLATLIGIEQSMVDAIRDLVGVLASGRVLEPVAFEKKLAAFGKALLEFDKFDQASNSRGVGTTTIFAMVDALAQQAAGGETVHDAVLQLRSEARGRPVEKIFLSAPAPSAAMPATVNRASRSRKRARSQSRTR